MTKHLKVYSKIYNICESIVKEHVYNVSPILVEKGENFVVSFQHSTGDEYILFESCYDDNENIITNPDIVIAVENAINTYDFYNTSEEIEEILINEMRESYDCDA